MARPQSRLLARLMAGLLLVLCATPEAPSSPFKVMVEAASSEVDYGGTLLLNCSSNCPEPNAPRGLETSLSKEVVGRGPGWLSVRLHNITQPFSEVFCYFSCFGRRETATFPVLAYELHQPQLSFSTPSAVCNEPVTISCIPEPSKPDGQKLRLLSSLWHAQNWSEAPLHLEVVVREEDDGAEFTCQTQLSVGNRMIEKSSATARLPVQCAPRMDDGSCPPSQNWTEGQDETLHCSARGNPPPRLECAKDGEPFTAGVPQPVTRDHTGTYRCWAINPLGAVERDITVWVHYHDIDWLHVVVLPTLLLVSVLVAAGVGYGIYYRKKKVRRYQLQQREQQRQRQQQKETEMQTLRPPGRPEETAALNGSAQAAQV